MKRIHESRVLCARTLIALATIVFLGCSQEILAQQWTNTGTNDIANTNSGNVGVGTNTPDIHAKLHVFKPASAGIDIQSSNSGGWSRVRLVTGTRTYGFFAGDGSEGLAPNKIGLYDYNAGAFRMMVDSSGNVGFGTSSPPSRLSVVGPVQNGVFTVFIDSTAGGQAGSQHGIQINGTSATTYLSAGATSVFGAAPHVNVNAADNTNYAVTFGNTGGWGRVVRLRSSSSDSTVPVMRVEGSNGSTVALSAQANGTVGVGTGSPDASYKLDVVGNVRVSGNIAAKYQDVAEWVETSQALPAATVVVLHANRSNHVVASSRAYDTRVAGVISSQPGLILGERAENKVLVATTGRVKIKVDATRGAIRVGDLLVTSNKEGLAMKSRPISVGGARIHRPGTIIGKALEPLANGRGEILVLLSLQ